MNDLLFSATLGIGITSLVSVAVFCMIAAQSLFFLIAYINRVLKIGFLIIISPLISITYSIDKMGDGKAQALNNWLKEFSYTVLIQPFHCIIYMALINTAFELVTGAQDVNIANLPNLLQSAEFNKLANGVLAILCIKFVNDGEKIVRKIFGFSDDNKGTSMVAGAVATMAVLKKAKSVGTATRKGINTVTSKAGRISEALGNDFLKFKDSNAGKAVIDKLDKLGVSKAADNISKKAKGFSDAVKGSAFGRGAGKVINGASTLHGKFTSSKLAKSLKRSTPAVLGAMAMAMTYASGDTGLLEANATRLAISDGSAEFFNSSKNTIASNEEENLEKIEEQDYKNVSQNLDSAKAAIDQLGFDQNMDAKEAHKVANSTEAQNANTNAVNKEVEARKLRDDLEKAKKELERERENLRKAEEEKAKAKTHRERVNAQKKIDQAKNEIKKKEAREQQLTKATERKQLEAERWQAEAERYNQLEAAVAKRDALEREKKNFFTEAARKQRIIRMSSGPKASELQKKKNEIIQMIMNYQNKVSGQMDSESATELAERMSKYVESDVLRGKDTMSEEAVVRKFLGAKSPAINVSDMAEKLNEYKILQRRKSVSEAFSRHAEYNGSTESLVNAMYKKLNNRTKNIL